jgi:uncharacterized coiled-coil DUF342 family protein
MDMLKEENKLIKQITILNEENFFLRLSVNLKWNMKTTKHQVLEVHKNISTGKKELKEYSEEIQKVYFSYLDFIDINH